MPWWMLPLVILSNFLLGFMFGMFHERWNWNVLIRQGKIPAPKKGD